jgi:threonine dehydratase
LEPESVTFDLCRRAIGRSVLVSEDEILDALRWMLHEEHWVIEGAAAVAVAAFRKEAKRYEGKKAAVVVCGRNISEAVGRRLFGC